MQAAMITYLPAAPGGAEAPGETAAAGHTGHGMRISSAVQAGINDTLFTTILQKGISIDTALGLSAGDIPLMFGADAMKDAEEEDTADACGLLMQMLVLNAAAEAGGGQDAPDETALHGVLGVIGDSPDAGAGTVPEGLRQAASVIVSKDGKAAEVLSALAETKNAAEHHGRAEGLPEGKPSDAPFKDVMAGITGALQNEMRRSDAPQGAPAAAAWNEAAAGTAEAGPADISAGSQTPVSTEAKAHSPSAAPGNSGLPAAEAAANERPGVPPVAGKTDGENGDGSPGGPASREKDNSGAAAAAGGANGALPDTGMKSGTAAEKVSAVERALNRFADDVMSVRGGSREIRIVLEPESLGVLTISVIKTESGISAKIRSEDKEIAAIISDHVQRLISSMESKGITVSDVDVTYGQAEQGTGFAQHGFSQARDESPKGNPLPPERNPVDDTANPEAWQTYYDGGGSGDTTVDYRV